MQQAHVRRSWRVHADDDVGLVVQLAPGDQAGAGVGVGGVGKPRRGASAGFDDHLLSGGQQSDHAIRTQRDPPFPGRRFGDGAHSERTHVINSRGRSELQA
jgi:hypothetical protein